MESKSKHEDFLERLKSKNPEAYENLEFLEEYVSSRVKIRARDKYGVLLVTPSALLSGKTPTIEIAENKTLYFIEKCKDVLDVEYDYSKVKYIKSNVKVKIICERGHLFETTPNSLLLGHGCSKCRAINLKERDLDKREISFKKKSL